MYKLKYLPIARNDLVEIIRYVAGELGNKKAAENLAEEFAGAGERIAEYPYAAPAYIPVRSLEHEYRKMSVQNYLIFYWVNEENKTITVARVIYAKRDYEKML
ncbi:MAG: type II toxin-antitoxin system RelE/ParE family toxin [Oscillospiraceae bacterium]|nr:type II toxin-antitoxin system RelE/ParE family toxin [Oscillospiraceae bacterium]